MLNCYNVCYFIDNDINAFKRRTYFICTKINDNKGTTSCIFYVKL